MDFKGLTSPSHMSLQEAGYGSEEGQFGSEISGAVSGVTTPGASRLQASQSQERSTTMQRLQGGGRASPGGVLSTVVRGARCQAPSLPWPPVLWSGQPGFRVPCVPGAVGAGVGTQHRPHSVRPCGPALPAVGVAEERPRGGSPSTIVRGVWCQALSLPRPSVLWSRQPGFRVPGVPGAVGAGVGTQHRSHSACALAGRRCSPWGWRKGVPGGGCLPPL